ncbi:MAG: protein-ADP-ribose hydrolase, partial [Anaeroplasmataceae bacterium]|nr:protein-ADP-ribose hydrolase [Anaeroplasmataceae bacterium]
INMSALEQAILYLKEYNQIKDLVHIFDFNHFRALMNVTMPKNLDEKYYEWEKEILESEFAKKTLTYVDEIKPVVDKLCLWQGDITSLVIDGIVNACNPQLLGCFQPLHSCIDNAIHSYAGLGLRRDLMEVMQKQGHKEPVGSCKVTSGYHLKAKYILHTVGPMIVGFPDEIDKAALKSCYLACLEKAEQHHISTLAFCSISTGVYGYPILEACKVAIEAVYSYFLKHSDSIIQKVVFNVFKDYDYQIYHKYLLQLKDVL